MECNNEEAVMAMTIAEKKFIERDYDGAKKFALKAQSMDPDLEGLSQMLSALGVYISAGNIISGEVDWYCVLGVDYLADDKTVRQQYHKLALKLHPDKNKFIGADGAFKLVQDAWVLLSDKEKKLAYDQKLNHMRRQQRVSTQTKVPSAQHDVSNFLNNKSAATSHTNTLNENTQSRPTSVPSSSQKLVTFSTNCRICMMRYDVSRNMMWCPNCYKPFLPLFQKLLVRVRTNHAANNNPNDSFRNGGQGSGCEGFGNGCEGFGNVASTSSASDEFKELMETSERMDHYKKRRC